MADGRVLLNVPAEFDLDGDGQIGPHEATLLVTGGIDTGTLLPLATPLLAPGGSQVATLAVRLSQTLGLSAADAGDAILQHFGLSSEVDLFSVDAIASSLAGDLNGSAVEAVVIQVQSTAVQIGRLLSGTSAVSLSHAALAAFDALAARIVAGEAASLGESVAVEALAGAAAARLAVTLPSEQLAAAAAVIAEGNRRIAELPLAADLAYLQHLKAIQAVALQAVAGDLELLGAGQLPVADLVARHTGQALDVQIAAAEIGSIVPPAVSILDAVPLPISTTGSVIHEFSVALSQRAALPVIVQYETFVAAGNVQWLPPIAGSFTIAPGQTQATIAIPVDMTEVPSHQAVYFVRLTTSEHATLGQPITTGTFDGPAQIVLAELPAAAVTTQPLTLLAAWTDLPGQTHTATIDWGDGTVEPAVLEQGAAGASLESAMLMLSRATIACWFTWPTRRATNPLPSCLSRFAAGSWRPIRKALERACSSSAALLATITFRCWRKRRRASACVRGWAANRSASSSRLPSAASWCLRARATTASKSLAAWLCRPKCTPARGTTGWTAGAVLPGSRLAAATTTCGPARATTALRPGAATTSFWTARATTLSTAARAATNWRAARATICSSADRAAIYSWVDRATTS